ncbi:MAG TPA: class I SAM-dependent methyltransferase [Vicinamibacterales bacterium]|nr:class I SAM-dependent methyltransferase [Vicinamibacterales bacterium]
MSQPPLPELSHYWANADERQRVVNSLFARSARHYDRACDIMSFGTGRTYRRTALERAGVEPGMRVLDVGTGTGQLAQEAARLVGSTGSVIGLDPSREMMTVGPRTDSISFVQGLGEFLPLPDRYFDFVTMGYALRHVRDLDQTFVEYFRVLKPGGHALLLEITRPRSAIGYAMMRAYFGTVVPSLARLGTRSADAARLMRFYWDTIANCVPPEVVLASLRRSGFAAAERRCTAGIFSEYIATREG